MANWYYLVSQLPSLNVSTGTAPLPITDEAFMELCVRFLDPQTIAVLSALSLEPLPVPEQTGSAVVDAWNEMESNLRLALATVRAQKLKKIFELPAVSLRQEALQAARTAAGLESPLAAELYLNEFRLDWIDRIAPLEIFSTEALYVYALRLKILTRIRKFNEEAGMKSYRTIYDKILGEAK